MKNILNATTRFLIATVGIIGLLTFFNDGDLTNKNIGLGLFIGALLAYPEIE